MNELAKAFTIAHRMGHDRPDVGAEERQEFRRIARLIWKAAGAGWTAQALVVADAAAQTEKGAN